MLRIVYLYQIRFLHLAVLFGIVCWSAILGGLYSWAARTELAHHDRLIELKALALGRQTQSLRRWIGGHGGVYVETGGDVAPVEHLAGLEDRDIRTPGGRTLTLLNFPSLLRRIVEEFEADTNDRIRLISYDPINPSGLPDPWEKAGLDMLQDGNEEIRERVVKDGREVFRLLYPIRFQPRCVRCHEDWGNAGQKVVGGLSVIVDNTPYDQSYSRLVRNMRAGYLGIWLSGVIGLLIFDFFGAKLLRKLEYASTHDRLTGLKNRAAIERRLDEEIQRAERYQTPLSVLLLDIDHFKRINDRYGHHIGDETLRIVGSTLKMLIRKTDTAGRFGGEEFLILTPNTDMDSSEMLANRILDGFRSAPVRAGKGSTISITASIGVSSFSEQLNDAEKLLKSADKALYRAKDQGRDQFCMHNSRVL
mgnify:CR=1 FL=1